MLVAVGRPESLSSLSLPQSACLSFAENSEGPHHGCLSACVDCEVPGSQEHQCTPEAPLRFPRDGEGSPATTQHKLVSSQLFHSRGWGGAGHKLALVHTFLFHSRMSKELCLLEPGGRQGQGRLQIWNLAASRELHELGATQLSWHSSTFF